MASFKRALAMASATAVVSAGMITTGAAVAQDESMAREFVDGECFVGVSWNNFQQPRWAATDRPNMQRHVIDNGGDFLDFDANLDNLQQDTDIETLINRGADVLVLLAQDTNAIVPSLQKAKDAGIPVIAYDRLIEDPEVLYITFDNTGVGEAEAAALFEAVPEGTYVIIKGDPGDPNASTFLPAGFDNAGLADKVAAGEITVFDEQFIPAWSTQTAQDTMEAIIDAANAEGVQIDAVLAENDSTALGVAGALQAQGYDQIPVSGQDGDQANLQNVAAGWQYVSVWKDSNELGKVAGEAALQLCEGKTFEEIVLPDGFVAEHAAPPAGNAPAIFTTPAGNDTPSFVLAPTPLTAENLETPLAAGWRGMKPKDYCVLVPEEEWANGPAICQLAAQEAAAATE
jgi:D-xylose transport system substrate-binding protein